ncbi:hypothetical protein L1987_48445 [Smallanthus sonchifolius]|uniref:Uncharacterized protein n=1 Tax=Smallanthus sonchifolius TaxID=185202 RepID=A0ACB9FT30_9ASTR|nr:hypothetical protein L1987_48445 [Smallanthus sonchifolius]
MWLIITPDLMGEISKAQDEALLERNIKRERIVGQQGNLDANAHGVRTRFGRMWIPKIGELRAKILDEGHKSRYSIHPGTNKMYQDLKKEYWWPGMKNDVTEYVSKCLTCSLVKAEHQKPCGKIQPLPIPEWKWEEITMDFITKLPRTAKGNDTIWVIVNRLTKSAHFLPIRETSSSERLAEIFIKEVKFNEAMGTRLNISTAYHPQTDGQSKRTIQTLEDMVRACIIDFGGSWDSHLPLAEFSYNNSYHSTIGMPPFEMLYGRKCRTPVCWGEIGQKDFASLEVVKATSEKFDQIKARMKAAKDRHKSYADKRIRDLEFQVGDIVLLKVSPWKGIIRFRKRGKLSPRFVGPFKILARVGQVAYRLDLPVELSGIHPTFHVSHLRNCLADDTAHIPYEEIEVDNSLNYVEEPIAILDRAEKRLRNKSIPLVKIQWKHRKVSEATWEKEDEMRGLYPQLFNETGVAYLSSTQEGLPVYLPSTQKKDHAYLPSTQEKDHAYLPSTQEKYHAYLRSTQEKDHAYLSSAHEQGPAHLLSAQTADQSYVTLLDLCLGQPRLAFQKCDGLISLKIMANKCSTQVKEERVVRWREGYPAQD